ncbi:16S rRNA (guanine(527)-N(7))-methyltransferase RsmG [Marivita hallyeonensis]|uniref:Ribosomal RNA small subunit methyltransferase G n=1 Tax=Marivita hallyeonensis TaxID=996342 RepID=A0A1M5UE62_9RHOB|nr:16S rRNA (guanine(527)-N(7))-methyltransferase RsmG [Marivita hallyeonensis]SHH61116.1 16S rRNA m(7)G-527 methyltransferase [Marivita hallyeonensis]
MNVSRETSERLATYLELLKKWSKKINLVSPASLKDARSRHFADSIQLARLCKESAKTWVDLGSGGGFPGAVVAIVLAEERPDLSMTLVESDQRKCAFLRSVSRETSVPFNVIAKRIEDVAPLKADMLSARALAPLTDLCTFAERHLHKDGTALFPKGAKWVDEVKTAQKKWRFSLQTHTSETSPEAVILEIGELSRA